VGILAFIVVVVLLKVYQKYMQKLAKAEAVKEKDETPPAKFGDEFGVHDPADDRVKALSTNTLNIHRIRKIAAGAEVNQDDMRSYMATQWDFTGPEVAAMGINNPKGTQRISALYTHLTGTSLQIGASELVQAVGTKASGYVQELLAISGDHKLLKSQFGNHFIDMERHVGPEDAVLVLDVIEHLILRATGGAAPQILKVKVRHMSVARQEELVARAIQYNNDGRNLSRERQRSHAKLKAGINMIQNAQIANSITGGSTEVVGGLGSGASLGVGGGASQALISQLMENASQLGQDALEFLEDDHGLNNVLSGAGSDIAREVSHLGSDVLGASTLDFLTQSEGDIDQEDIFMDQTGDLANLGDGGGVLGSCCEGLSSDLGDSFSAISDFGLDGVEQVSKEITALASKLKATIKILASHLQILSSLEVTLEIPWPAIFTDFTMNLSFINLEIFEILPAGCYVTTDFFQKLVLTMLFPVICYALLAGFVIYSSNSMRKQGNSLGARKAIDNGMMAFFLFTYIIYPGVSAEILRMFACDKIGKEDYLRADYTLKCTTSRYYAYFLVAVGGIFLYPFGIPFVFFVLLYRNRHRFHLEETQYRYGFLYDQYESDKWYYELIELMRKLILTGTIIFFLDGSISQISFALLVSCIFLMFHIALQAYLFDDDDFLQVCAMGTATATLFLGILLRAQEVEAEDGAQESTQFGEDVMGFTLVFIQIFVVVVSLYCVIGKKLIPQFRDFSHRIKKMQITMRQNAHQKSMPGHMFQEAARLQYEMEMAGKFGIRFRNDDGNDIALLQPILRKYRDSFMPLDEMFAPPQVKPVGSAEDGDVSARRMHRSLTNEMQFEQHIGHQLDKLRASATQMNMASDDATWTPVAVTTQQPDASQQDGHPSTNAMPAELFDHMMASGQGAFHTGGLSFPNMMPVSGSSAPTVGKDDGDGAQI